jgi:hypothetical protein
MVNPASPSLPMAIQFCIETGSNVTRSPLALTFPDHPQNEVVVLGAGFSLSPGVY